MGASRGAERRQRVTEANPTIPFAVFGLLVLAAAASVGWIAFQLPRIQGRRVFIIALGILLFFAGSLIVLKNIARPFGGVTGIPPTEILITEKDITEDFVDRYGAERLPCDDQGMKT